MRKPIYVSPERSREDALSRVIFGLGHHPHPRGRCRCISEQILCQRCNRGVIECLGKMDESDYCRWCARPITEEALRTVPLDGYVAIARHWLGERTYGDNYDPIGTEEIA